MKLSEMDTEQLAACLCELAPALDRISADDSMSKTFANIAKKLDGKWWVQQIAQIVCTFVPMLMGAHFDDMVTIVAVMTGKTEECVRKQKGMETIRDVNDFFDKDFFDFFKSSAAQEPKA